MNYTYFVTILMVCATIGFAGCGKDGEGDDEQAGLISLKSDGNLTIDKTGGDVTIKFSATKDWTISVAGENNWISVAPVSGVAGEDITITGKASANKTGADRKADLSVSAGGTPVTVSASQTSYQLISKMDLTSTYSEEVLEFGYDVLGRLTQYKGFEYDKFEITYTNDQKVRIFKDTYTGNELKNGNIYEYTATLDGDGKTTSISGTEEYISETGEFDWKYNISAALTYSSDNELTKCEYQSINVADPQNITSIAINFTWENGSIKSCSKTEGNIEMQYSFNFGTEKNDLNVDLFMQMAGPGLYSSDWHQILFAADLLGKRSALLPSIVSQDGNKTNYTYTRTGDIISKIACVSENGDYGSTFDISYKK